MLRRVVTAPLVASLALLGARTARADVVFPRDDGIERCTLENWSAADRDCRACQVSRMAATVCEAQLQPQGFARKCQTRAASRRGSSRWEEVWCRDKDRKPPSAPPTSPTPHPMASASSVVDAGAEPSPPPPPVAATTVATTAVPAPAPTSTAPAGPPSDAGGPSSIAAPASAEPSRDEALPAAGPSGAEPGPRGCGSCVVGALPTESALAGLGAVLVALVGARRLGAHARRRRDRLVSRED